MSEEAEKKAEKHADRVTQHDIDSLRFAMRDPFRVAKADFLAGYHSRNEEIEKLKREIENLEEDRDFHREQAAMLRGTGMLLSEERYLLERKLDAAVRVIVQHGIPMGHGLPLTKEEAKMQIDEELNREES